MSKDPPPSWCPDPLESNGRFSLKKKKRLVFSNLTQCETVVLVRGLWSGDLRGSDGSIKPPNLPRQVDGE